MRPSGYGSNSSWSGLDASRDLGYSWERSIIQLNQALEVENWTITKGGDAMPVPPIDYEEKRDFRRMEIECRIAYCTPGSDTVLYGVGRNLSATGMLFEAGEPQAPGVLLEVSIEPGNPAVRAFRALIEVIRCRPVANGCYEIAGEIREFRS